MEGGRYGRTKMFRWKRAAAVAVVVGLGLTGCSGTGGGSTTSSGGTTSGTLTLGAAIQPSTFSAQNAQWGNEAPYEQAVYDTLLHASAKDNSPIPWLATSWSYSSDNTVLTMKLRDDVTFTDGTKFTADVAAQNLIRFRDGTSGDKGHLASLKDAKASDATTLVLTLTQPDPALLSVLAQDAGLMESPKAFTSKTVATVPVGSGPYALDTSGTVAGSKYVFKKNDKYWAKGKFPQWNQLVISVLASAQNQVNAARGGQVDGLLTTDATTFDQFKSAGFTLVQQDLDWAGILILDRGGKVSKPLGDVRVRQALNYAVDRKALLKAIQNGSGTLTDQVFPTYSPGYDKSLDSYYSYDPAKAKALLKAAGYSSGVTLTFPQIAGFTDTANALVTKYLKDVGITVKQQTLPTANVISDILAPKFAITYFSLQEDPVASQEVNFLLTKNAVFNPYKYEDPKVTAWAKTIQTGSTADANAATKALNRYTVEQAWNVPFYRVKNTFATNSKITVTAQAGNNFPYLYNIKPKG
jgi:peptide/nickel transport system substrate-binding protein